MPPSLNFLLNYRCKDNLAAIIRNSNSQMIMLWALIVEPTLPNRCSCEVAKLRPTQPPPLSSLLSYRCKHYLAAIIRNSSSPSNMLWTSTVEPSLLSRSSCEAAMWLKYMHVFVHSTVTKVASCNMIKWRAVAEHIVHTCTLMLFDHVTCLCVDDSACVYIDHITCVFFTHGSCVDAVASTCNPIHGQVESDSTLSWDLVRLFT